jgi:hypothetical protein
MPFVYSDVPGALQTTSATALTANDCAFVKPGATRPIWLKALFLTGRGAALTAVTGITVRLEKWFTTASSGGTSITPSPKDDLAPAATHTAAYAAATVTSGTGGPTLLASCGCGAASPGPPWMAPTLDDSYELNAAATKSIDMFCVSGVASMNFEAAIDVQE